MFENFKAYDYFQVAVFFQRLFPSIGWITNQPPTNHQFSFDWWTGGHILAWSPPRNASEKCSPPEGHWHLKGGGKTLSISTWRFLESSSTELLDLQVPTPLDATAPRKNAGNRGGKGQDGCHDVLGCAQTVPTGKGAMKGIMFKKDDHGELETELHYQVRCSPNLDEI